MDLSSFPSPYSSCSSMDPALPLPLPLPPLTNISWAMESENASAEGEGEEKKENQEEKDEDDLASPLLRSPKSSPPGPTQRRNRNSHHRHLRHRHRHHLDHVDDRDKDSLAKFSSSSHPPRYRWKEDFSASRIRSRNGTFCSSSFSSRCYAPRAHEIVGQENESAEEECVSRSKSSQRNVRKDVAEAHFTAAAKRSDPGIRSPDLYQIKRRPSDNGKCCEEDDKMKKNDMPILIQHEQMVQKRLDHGNCGLLAQKLSFLEAVKGRDFSEFNSLIRLRTTDEALFSDPTGLETEIKCDGVESASSEDQYKKLARLLVSDTCSIDGESDTFPPVQGRISSDSDESLSDSMDMHMNLKGKLLPPHNKDSHLSLKKNGQEQGNMDDSAEKQAIDCHLKNSIQIHGSDNCAFVDVTNNSLIKSPKVLKATTQESDGHRVNQRQRQIEFGKNTLGYERYIEAITRDKRKKSDPRTPEPKQVCSKRSWDGQIRKWRRLLHEYDPPGKEHDEMAEDFTKCHIISDTEKEENRSSEVNLTTKEQIFENKEEALIEDASSEIYEDWTAAYETKPPFHVQTSFLC